MLRGEREHAVEVRGVAVEMHRDHADRARRDERLDLLDVQTVAVVDVGENRPGAAVNERFQGRKGGVRRHDNFIARLQSLRQVKQIDNHRPRRTEDGVFGAGVSGQLGLEGLAFLAENVLAGAQRAQRGCFDLFVNEAFGQRDLVHGC